MLADEVPESRINLSPRRYLNPVSFPHQAGGAGQDVGDVEGDLRGAGGRGGVGEGGDG